MTTVFTSYSINVAKRLPADAFSKHRGTYAFRINLEDADEDQAHRIMDSLSDREFPPEEYLLSLNVTERTAVATRIRNAYED